MGAEQVAKQAAVTDSLDTGQCCWLCWIEVHKTVLGSNEAVEKPDTVDGPWFRIVLVAQNTGFGVCTTKFQ